MKRCEPFFISNRIARTWGTRAAAVLALLYEDCQRQAKADGYSSRRYWVRMSQGDIARRLHLCRQTVAKILRTLEAEELILVKANANPSGRDRTRQYTLNFRAFGLLDVGQNRWQPHGKSIRLFWGLSEAVSSRAGVNAAIVFQFLWFNLHDGLRTPHDVRAGRVWLSYTASSLARWLPFLSREVIATSLKVLVAAGFLVTSRTRGVRQWAVVDEGFAAMNEEPDVSVALALRKGLPAEQKAAHLAVVSQRLSLQLKWWQLEKKRARRLYRMRQQRKCDRARRR